MYTFVFYYPTGSNEALLSCFSHAGNAWLYVCISITHSVLNYSSDYNEILVSLGVHFPEDFRLPNSHRSDKKKLKQGEIGTANTKEHQV